jgi:hypothetical protein
VAVTKVHFKSVSTKNSVNTEKFELVPKENGVKAVMSKERGHKKKVVSEWVEGLVYCPLSKLVINLPFISYRIINLTF